MFYGLSLEEQSVVLVGGWPGVSGVSQLLVFLSENSVSNLQHSVFSHSEKKYVMEAEWGLSC